MNHVHLLTFMTTATANLCRPLHGIPIFVTSNILTSATKKPRPHLDGFAMPVPQPSDGSSVASKLRKAGVLILGKTRIPERVDFRGVTLTSGRADTFTHTLGTYDHASCPDRSSAASAVATSLGLCIAALGTEVCKVRGLQWNKHGRR